MANTRRTTAKRSGAYIVGEHRYSLWRIWDEEKPFILFIGINPSDATEHEDDRTIETCIRYATRWGYGGLYFGNLYTIRSRNIDFVKRNLNRARGPECDSLLEGMIAICDKVICAWGRWKFATARAREVLQMIPYPYCLKKNADGSPHHPLYLNSDITPIRYEQVKD